MLQIYRRRTGEDESQASRSKACDAEQRRVTLFGGTPMMGARLSGAPI